MLYLNMAKKFKNVFASANLTLTSVVFEFLNGGAHATNTVEFNFNKCCIWIIALMKVLKIPLNLTLTSVVFESESSIMDFQKCIHLTLTSVVFEYFKAPISLPKPFYLTLTSVVFECVFFSIFN